MDHKKFFEEYGNHFIHGYEWLKHMPLTPETLYQAFKARMIEELCTETVKNEYGQHSFLRLIDTTKDTE